MFDRETWLFINSFAPWLAALGTVAAVIVSLYLSRRASRLDIRVFTRIILSTANEQIFQLHAVNHNREAIVSTVAWWSLGFGRQKQTWIFSPPDETFSAMLPCELGFGKGASFFFPTEMFIKERGMSVLEHVRDSKFPRLTVRLLRVGVVTSTDQCFRAPLNHHTRKFILGLSRQIST